GIAPGPDTTLVVDFPDLSDLSNVNVTVPPGLNASELFNFRNMTAAGFVSLLAGLSSRLEDFRNSKFFADLKIPFLKGAITDVLDFAESISEGLLFDDGANDTRDGLNKLASDLNAALVAANLDRQIVIQGGGTKVKFEAIDHTITEFMIEAGIG